MDGWTLFFIIVGVAWTVSKVMNFIFWLDDPRNFK